MRSTTFLAAALAGSAAAMPKEMARELFGAVARRASTYVPSSELWGEWKTATGLSDDQKILKKILQGQGSGTYEEGYEAPEMGSHECEADTCCIWSYVTAELEEKFAGCNNFARAAIRMGFHDSSSWTKNLDKYGADGSLLLHENELTDVRANSGGMVTQAPNMMEIYDKYKGYGVTMADLLQAGAKVGALVCKGPRMKMYVGREDHAGDRPPDGLLPAAFGDDSAADTLIALFEDKTVTPSALIALLGAHTVSNVNNGLGLLGPHPCTASPDGFPCPQDTSPSMWNTDYFTETMKETPSDGVYRFVSDTNLAASDVTAAYFSLFESDSSLWDWAYAKEYVRMSMFGVRNIKNIVDCSKAMPGGKKSGGGGGGHGGGHGGYNTKTTTKSYGDYKPTKSYSHYKPTMTTSTYTHTDTYTVYSCAPEVKDCPYNKDHPMTTESVYVTTTVCEVTPTYYPTSSAYDDHYESSKMPEYPAADYPADSSTYAAAPEYPAESSTYAAAPEYPASSTYAAAPVASDTPYVVSGAGRTVGGGFLAAAAGVLVALA